MFTLYVRVPNTTCFFNIKSFLYINNYPLSKVDRVIYKTYYETVVTLSYFGFLDLALESTNGLRSYVVNIFCFIIINIISNYFYLNVTKYFYRHLCIYYLFY